MVQTLTRLITLSCLLGWQSVSAPAYADDPKESVRIAGARYLGDVPTAVADALGLFAEHGIRAEIQYNASGQSSLAQLRSGEADFALTALTPVVLDRLADHKPREPGDPVILASLSHSSQLTKLLVRTDVEVDQPSDLAGKRVAVQCGTNADFAWSLFQQYHGLDASSVQKVCMAFDKTPEALQAGRVDAAVLPAPWSYEASANLQAHDGSELREFDLSSIYTGAWVILTSRRFLDEHLELSSRVLSAYRDAIEIIERKPDEALTAYNKKGNHHYKVQGWEWEALDYDINLTWVLLSGIRQQLHWAWRSEPTRQKEEVHILELIDSRSLYRIQPNAVHIPTTATESVKQ